MNLVTLVQSIQKTHDALKRQVASAINLSATIHNWMIGYYIAEFEQKGENWATSWRKITPIAGERAAECWFPLPQTETVPVVLQVLSPKLGRHCLFNLK